MYSFARQPKWIAAHALFIVLLAIFVLAGFWQFSRHQWRSDLNDAIEARADLATMTLGDVSSVPIDDIEFRTVRARGRFDQPDILIRSRSLDGQPGCHVVTTFATDDAGGLVIDRGWLPLRDCERYEADAPTMTAPTGEMEIEGRIHATETRGRFGAADPPEGVLVEMARVDVARIQQQTPFELEPFYLQQTAPDTGGLPRLLPPPPTDGGPHLGYTVQWFSFAVVALVGYPLVLRRQARATGIAED